MSSWRRSWNLVWPSLRLGRWSLVLMLLIILVTAITQVLEPVVYGHIVDTMISHLSNNTAQRILTDITPWLLLWIVLFVVTTLLSTWLLYIGWRFANASSAHFAHRIAEQCMAWSHQRVGSVSTTRITKLFDDAWEGVFGLIDNLFLQTLPTFLTFFMVVCVGLWIDWRMTLASLFLLPVAIGLGLYAFKRADPQQEALNSSWADATRTLGENLTNLVEIRNFAQETRRSRMFTRHLDKVLKLQLKINVFWAIFHGFGGGIQLLARVIVFVIGVLFVSHGSLTLGTMVTFLGLLGFILTPIQHTISYGFPRLSKALTSFKLLTDLLEQENDVQEQPGAKPLKQARGAIELQHISFSYKDTKGNALHNINLTIPAGTSCALVGPSGAGKSTLAKLLNRTLDPTSGSLLLDGQDAQRYTLASLRKHIGVVSQDPVLFHESILANLRFAKPGATQQEIETACKRAQAHTFIKRLPKGYQSIVGERGVKLSGGERQRIALARIFLANPPILILDESTSALDSETEQKLQVTLRQVMRGRTTILIAHRLSTIYLADQICVVERGRIVAQGTHHELMQKEGLYNRLWSLQAGGYLQ